MVSDIPTEAAFPEIAHYVLPDKDKHMVDSWACSDKVITVGNHYNVVAYTDYAGNWQSSTAIPGDISLNSSWGPTRDERQKPDMTATGDVTFSASTLEIIDVLIALEPNKVDPGGMHVRGGGTSIASPVVAGAVALYLQKCPTAPISEIIAALHATAVSDQFTGAVPNKIHGYGKLDAFALLNTSNLDPVSLIAESDEMCSNEPIDISVSGDFDSFLWSNGGTTDPLAYAGAGPLSVIAYNASGCRTFSDTLNFTLLQAPGVPVISSNGLELTSTPGDAYQWYMNDELITGAVAQTFIAGSQGTYTVEVIAANGCSAMSAPQQVIITGIDTIGTAALAGLWPSPTQDRLTLRIPDGAAVATRISVLDPSGKLVLANTVQANGTYELSVAGLSAGTYAVRMERGTVRWEGRFVKLP